MEFENVAPPPWSIIKENVLQSSCILVLLSNPLDSYGYGHTRNWIDFEVGLACAMNKDVWVLEPWFQQVHQAHDFMVPYCTHYSLYEPENIDHLKYFKNTFEEYSKPQPAIAFGEGVHQCVEESCRLSFFLMSNVEEFKCPSCKTILQKQSNILQTFLVGLQRQKSQD